MTVKRRPAKRRNTAADAPAQPAEGGSKAPRRERGGHYRDSSVDSGEPPGSSSDMICLMVDDYCLNSFLD
eukprot:9060093-Pyramimonas_sp.AAC.1